MPEAMTAANMVVIGLGSNLPSPAGTPAETLSAAVKQLESEGFSDLRVSPLYLTRPVPVSDQPAYVNAVATARTRLAPEAALAALHRVEARLGRIRGAPNAPRTLDLDLLAYDDVVREAPPPVLPHPRLHQRRFVLAPLVDLAPDWRHPVLRRTARALLQALPPGAAVLRLGL